MTLGFTDDLEPKKHTIHAEWENARDRDKASRSRFAQHTLSPEAVAAELQSVRAAIGRSEDVARFFGAVLQAATVPVKTTGKAVTVHLSHETPRALRQAIGRDEPFTGRFDRNRMPTAIEQHFGLLLPTLPLFQRSLAQVARERAAAQLTAHERVREPSRTKGRVTFEPVLPLDILGVYSLLPRLP